MIQSFEATKEKTTLLPRPKSDDANDKVPTPLFGGIMKVNSGEHKHVFAWSGTDPDAKMNCYSWNQEDPGAWVINAGVMVRGQPRMKGPPHDGMYRPTGVKFERHTRLSCTTYVSDIHFNGMTPSDGKIAIKLKVYKGSTRLHMIVHGMWDLFNVTDDTTGQGIDILLYHSKVTKEKVRSHVERINKHHDTIVQQNLAYSGAYICASLSPEILGKLLREVSIDASGPETYSALMRVVYSDSYLAMQKIKRQLEAIKLSAYSGENVEQCCDNILSHSDQLDAAGAFAPDLLCTIVQIFEGTTDHRLMTWAMTRYEIVAARVKYLHSMQLGVEADDPQHYNTICGDMIEQ